MSSLRRIAHRVIKVDGLRLLSAWPFHPSDPWVPFICWGLRGGEKFHSRSQARKALAVVSGYQVGAAARIVKIVRWKKKNNKRRLS